MRPVPIPTHTHYQHRGLGSHFPRHPSPDSNCAVILHVQTNNLISYACICDPRRQHQCNRLLVLLAFKQRVLEDVAQCEYALELVLFIDYDEAVYAAPANCVVDGGELVLHRARVYAGEILYHAADISIVETRRWG